MASTFLLCALSAVLLLATSAMAQQGPGSAPPPPKPATPVQENELVETWNERVSVGPPVGAMPEFDGWSMGHAMPLARSEHGVAELDGKIWVLGGYPPGRLPSNLVQIYDPAAGRWTLGPRLPQPIHHTHAAAVGGKLYVIGGEIDGASTGRPEIFVNHVWMHDPAIGGWVQRASMPTARSGGGKAVIDGKIYVAGGRPPGGHAFEVYDPATDKGRWGAIRRGSRRAALHSLLQCRDHEARRCIRHLDPLACQVLNARVERLVVHGMNDGRIAARNHLAESAEALRRMQRERIRCGSEPEDRLFLAFGRACEM
ncbi:MAG TPA: hypothetical protein VGF48_02450 [Thermoanaerobaculia bacterium]